MIPSPAQYLLRFDDLCPAMSLGRWERFQPLIEEYGLQPILSVVPNNRDPELEFERPDPEFWKRMRALEAAGATIGIHGYRHLCTSHGRSLVPLHRFTEFAGIPIERQRVWIHSGLQILRDNGLNPRVWVAPRHGFDGATLRALREEGIKMLSDGFARVPFRSGGLTWIPQQLWAPVEKGKGIWTICLHANTGRDELVRRLQRFLDSHVSQFSSVDRVLAEFQPVELEMNERLYETWALWRVQATRLRARLVPRPRKTA